MPTKLKPLKLSVVPLAELVLDPANARRHPDANQAAALASLSRFGAGRSVVQGGDGLIIAGNLTVEKAREAGITEAVVIESDGSRLVVVRRTDLKGAEAAAYALADNRVAELAEWEPQALAAALASLDADQRIAAGFSAAEASAALDRSTEPPEDFPAVDETLPTEHKCPKCGYKWSGGEHEQTGVSNTDGESG